MTLFGGGLPAQRRTPAMLEEDNALMPLLA